jgi:hypothetical protein
MLAAAMMMLATHATAATAAMRVLVVLGRRLRRLAHLAGDGAVHFVHHSRNGGGVGLRLLPLLFDLRDLSSLATHIVLQQTDALLIT